MNLRGQISGLVGQILGLRGQVTGLKGQISGLRGQIQGLRGQISGLRGQILGLRGQISGLRGSEERADGRTQIRPLMLQSSALRLQIRPDGHLSLRKAFTLEGLQSAHYSSSSMFSGRTNKSLLVFYRTLSPLGPLPCFPSLLFTITQSGASGIADHILPLGDLLLFVLTTKAWCLESTRKLTHQQQGKQISCQR